jgi:hypothetical protein
VSWQDHRRIGALAAVTVADAEGHAGQHFRVVGRLASDPVFWAPRGIGRGGNPPMTDSRRGRRFGAIYSDFSAETLVWAESGFAGPLEDLLQFLAADAVEFGLADLVDHHRAALAAGFAAAALPLRFRGRELTEIQVIRLSRFREWLPALRQSQTWISVT